MLLCILMIPCGLREARADIAGPNSPSAATADSSSGGSVTWTNPTNVYTNDNVLYATASGGGGATTYYLNATGFGFSIPTGVTINGIVVEVDRKSSDSGPVKNIVDYRVRIVKGGNVGATTREDTSTKWPTSDAYATYGTQTDLWGDSWAGSDINNVNFGVAIAATLNGSQSRTASIDHIRITVYYTDTSPPTPNPMTFASAPANVSASQISMTATTGSDSTVPVNYLFTNDNSSCGANAGTGGASSSWQSSTSYPNTGLQANKCYGYTVTARDSVSPTPNTGTASSISFTYTSASTPGTPTLSGATTTTLNLTNAENGNPSSNPTTYFAVQVVTTSPNHSTWLNKWVNGSGNPSATEVWLTDAQLDALVLQGLTSGTTYGVKVKARNQDGDETALSGEGQRPTAIDLLSFEASGAGEQVKVLWQTAQESDNKGFNLYRGTSPSGPWVKLNGGLIPSGSVSSEGRDYEFMDTAVSRGAIYYYKLEDLDVSGAVKLHGPVCVDWDGDGIPDDWENAHGLNPAVNDAALDSDGDGVPNRLEYQRGTNPRLRDTDGDGVLDGAEKKNPGYSGGVSNLGADASVQVLASDSRGLTLELTTKSFDVTPVVAGGQAFERLRVPAYVHGFTLAAGLPQVPLKGILLDIPPGKQARVTVLDAASRALAGYRVYPAPVYQAGANNQVAELFSWDEASYRENAYYPAVAAELLSQYVFRGQAQQRLLFYPLRFNPATGELLHCERIRVRVEFVDSASASAGGYGGQVRAEAAQDFGGQVRAAAAAFQQAPAAAAAGAGGWAIPAGAAYKVSTSGEGIYRVTRDWLTAQGIGPTEIDAIDLSRVQLFNLGSEQALHIYDANANNRLDAEDYISFYAAAVPAAYAKYARYNVYWLIDAGSASPLRMTTINGAPGGSPLALSHQSTVHHELDQGYLQNSPGPDGMDRWLFPAVALGPGFAGGGTAQSFTLTLSGVAGVGELALRLYSPYAMEHSAAVALNSASLGSVTWSGSGFTEGRFAGVSLREGANTVAVTCESGADKIYFDWFEADYERSFAAAAGSLKFTHAGGFRYGITGFSTEDVELFDVSDASAVRRVVNGISTGSGPYSIEVEPAGAAGSPSYLAVAAAGRQPPAAIVKDRASSLAAVSNAADWILITHREIGWDVGGVPQNWVRSLVGLRQAQGLRTAVVEVTDIFDEFGYGLVSPQAIKDFITYAYENWQAPAAQYVLLMGDTTYDYKDNRSLGTVNYVPGYLIYTTYLGETISDDWYVQVSGADAVPDLYIGRLPANSAAQAEDMVAKIVAYERTANSKGWEKSLVLAADNQAEDWEAVFETINEDVAAFLPAGMATPERFYLQEYQNESLAVTDLTADLKAAINAGALIVNYSGHGSLNIWAHEHMIDNQGGVYRSDVTTLTNSGKYPFVVNMSCLTGYFIYPVAGSYAGSGWLSLAEGFMLPATQGAIAALMPTGMTDTTGQQVLSNALYEGIFVLDKRTLGPAVGYAKQQLLANGGAAYEETSNTFMYFGDPATSLKVPRPRRPAGLSALWPADGTVALSWTAALDCDGNAVAGYNLYRRLSTEDSYTKLNSAPITGLTHTDTGLSAAPAGATYYYALSAVDGTGDESVKSAAAGLTIADSGGGGGLACFIAATAFDRAPDLLLPAGVIALLGCLIGWSVSPAATFEERGCATRGAVLRTLRSARREKPPRLRGEPEATAGAPAVICSASSVAAGNALLKARSAAPQAQRSAAGAAPPTLPQATRSSRRAALRRRRRSSNVAAGNLHGFRNEINLGAVPNCGGQFGVAGEQRCGEAFG